MTSIKVTFHRVRDACFEAAQTGKADRLVSVLLSDVPLTVDDRKYLADFVLGKFKRKRGRPNDEFNQMWMESYADTVKSIKAQYAAQNQHISHEDAVEKLCNYLKMSSAFSNKLHNYLRRSKRKGKVPQ
jgi:hypothetical protein